ncbi:hypothetical protein ACFY94_07295 [Streptomyces griseorubiginosus]|uniref:hypothetical protein n=1 Tax=Streptomyces griseorubiginosus TaxID=67304 RepID=UPI0036E734E8
MVAVPKSQQIKSSAGIWRIDQVIEDAPADAWQGLSCGDRAKGPRVYDGAAGKLPANLIFDRDPPAHHRWVMTRHSLSDLGELRHRRTRHRAPLRLRYCRSRLGQHLGHRRAGIHQPLKRAFRLPKRGLHALGLLPRACRVVG